MMKNRIDDRRNVPSGNHFVPSTAKHGITRVLPAQPVKKCYRAFGLVCYVLTGMVVLLLFGCVNYLKPELGAVARPDARVLLVDHQVSGAVLKTKDLQLEYTFTGTGETFEIYGKLMFDRSITASYPFLRRFVMRVNFLDAEGAVIGTAGITPNINGYDEVPDIVELKASGIMPSGTAAVAFNYFGTFISSTISSGGNESWEAYYMPFD